MGRNAGQGCAELIGANRHAVRQIGHHRVFAGVNFAIGHGDVERGFENDLPVAFGQVNADLFQIRGRRIDPAPIDPPPVRRNSHDR